MTVVQVAQARPPGQIRAPAPRRPQHPGQTGEQGPARGGPGALGSLQREPESSRGCTGCSLRYQSSDLGSPVFICLVRKCPPY